MRASAKIVLLLVSVSGIVLGAVLSACSAPPSVIMREQLAARERELQNEQPQGWECAGPYRNDAVHDFDGDGRADIPLTRVPGSQPTAHQRQRIVALQPGEELWVIARPTGTAQPDDSKPGTGALLAKLPNQTEQVPVPLKHTDVHADVEGYIATVDVTQQYHNPFSEKIEAAYVFPLPANAAVNEFVMTVGERRIRGIIRERQEAERIYAAAKSQGYVASLMTQERPNIFTQSVANIEPGKNIDVRIRYFHTLAYVDGWYEFVFPMVVGPRFNPPGTTAGVGAISRGKPGRSGQQTEVQYLRPTERSGHDIAVAVRIDAGVRIEQVDSRNHAVHVAAAAAEVADVTLDARDSLPNKDFVLRYKVAGTQVKSALLTQGDANEGYFTLMLFPPDDLKTLTRQPMEMIFLLDCSGSMNGEPIAQSKAAIEHALTCMRPDDTFQIIRFSNNASQLGPAPLPATPQNIQRGLQYVRTLQGEGGTMAIEGVRAALNFPHDPRRIRTIAFLTDGFIGNEDEILADVQNKLGASRIFGFGVGSSPNRYLLDGVAAIGKGAVAYLGLHDDARAIMDQYFQRISHPALTDITVDWSGPTGLQPKPGGAYQSNSEVQVSDAYPRQIPDLFVGRPVILTGRFRGPLGAAPIRITGKLGNQMRTFDVNARGITTPTPKVRRSGNPVVLASSEEPAASRAGLPAVWARLKIADLSVSALNEPHRDWPSAIRSVALEYGLLSAYTAFVAVDSSARTAGDHGTTVTVPVPVPDGVRYDTTVNEK
jgi:Ca-activated chloride channel family protein